MKGNLDVRRPDDVSRARAILRAALGDAVLAELHRPALVWDVLAIVLVWATIGGCAYHLATAQWGFSWIVALVVQGFAQQLLILLFHDAFLHRRLGGDRWGWFLSCFLTMPLFIRPTAYKVFHLEHHRHIGMDLDTEAFKQNVDTPFKRLALATLPGYLMQRKWPVRDHLLTPKDRARLRLEARIQAVFAMMLLVGLVLWPRAIGLGYILPLFVTMPIASVSRIILEHAEANPENPFHLATFYRTGILTRVLFLWDSGDCHVIHHIYATIPFYRIGRAIDLMRPILVEHGVVERRSLVALFWGYFVKNFPHRTLWPVGAGQVTEPLVPREKSA